MKATQSKVLSLFNKNGRMYRKDLVEKCREKGLERKDYEKDIKTLIDKGIISSYDVLVDWVDYSVTLFVCNFEILGTEGDMVFIADKSNDD